MDKLIRIIVMIIASGALPFIANLIYEPFKKKEDLKELNIVEKILWGAFYIFILNWFIIMPSVVFFECFKYLINN